ncbi:MAG TPA: YfiR family protein [Steroidobacteraceae bacterium]|nr:YfiR family protein [Steroidobacteraceae bacterium]
MASLSRRIGAACLAAVLFCSPALPAAPAGEYQVKAVYLFNFSQFVEWPDAAFASPDAPFVICVVGQDPFAGALEGVLRGEKLNGHPLEARHLVEAAEATDCNIVFIARGQQALLDDALHVLQGRHVLTVTDAPRAEERGAMIVLFTDNNRIRMRINLAAARASQLVISSKLLRPAEVIGAGGDS